VREVARGFSDGREGDEVLRNLIRPLGLDLVSIDVGISPNSLH